LLIKIYNECKQQNITVAGCKSCGIQRYYTGLQNYVDLGTIILAKQGIDIF
jgi:16S rRNA G1207 methylase RsmC